MDYDLLKTAHILSATVLFGTGLGTAFHGLASNLRGDLRAIVAANKNVVLADWLFTTPAVVVQPVTGVLLARQRREMRGEVGITRAAHGAPWPRPCSHAERAGTSAAR